MHCAVLLGCCSLASHIRIIIFQSTKKRENYLYCIMEVGRFLARVAVGHISTEVSGTPPFCLCSVCVREFLGLTPSCLWFL